MTNLAFGDGDGKALYIMACDVIYRVRLKAEGIGTRQHVLIERIAHGGEVIADR